ncbi:hypothetical protein CERSUDRAFT_48050, partial [Gelatoporia subvermispora B]
SEHTYKFNVKASAALMTCSGCSGAVDRVLKKTEGVSSYDISLETQEVVVKGTVPFEEVLERIKKTGKEVRYDESSSGRPLTGLAPGSLQRGRRMNDASGCVRGPGRWVTDEVMLVIVLELGTSCL